LNPKKNSDFKLNTAENSALISMVTNMTNNSKRKLNKNNFDIKIGNQSNEYNILKIIIAEVNDKTNFHVSETELDLEVKKE
jgi:hypothetical protein